MWEAETCWLPSLLCMCQFFLPEQTDSEALMEDRLCNLVQRRGGLGVWCWLPLGWAGEEEEA